MTHVPRILVVDGDPLARFTVRRALVEHGCEVVEATDSVAAARPFTEKTGAFDLLLLDYETPDGDAPPLPARLHSLPPADFRRALPAGDTVMNGRNTDHRHGLPAMRRRQQARRSRARS